MKTGTVESAGMIVFELVLLAWVVEMISRAVRKVYSFFMMIIFVWVNVGILLIR